MVLMWKGLHDGGLGGEALEPDFEERVGEAVAGLVFEENLQLDTAGECFAGGGGVADAGGLEEGAAGGALSAQLGEGFEGTALHMGECVEGTLEFILLGADGEAEGGFEDGGVGGGAVGGLGPEEVQQFLGGVRVVPGQLEYVLNDWRLDRLAALREAPLDVAGEGFGIESIDGQHGCGLIEGTGGIGEERLHLFAVAAGKEDGGVVPALDLGAHLGDEAFVLGQGGEVLELVDEEAAVGGLAALLDQAQGVDDVLRGTLRGGADGQLSAAADRVDAPGRAQVGDGLKEAFNGWALVAAQRGLGEAPDDVAVGADPHHVAVDDAAFGLAADFECEGGLARTAWSDEGDVLPGFDQLGEQAAFGTPAEVLFGHDLIEAEWVAGCLGHCCTK